jgi:hypothetical protein
MRLPRLILAALLLSSCAPGTPQVQDTTTAAGILSGSASTPERCAATPAAFWVSVDGKGDCIRYYAAGLGAINQVAIVFFQGDLITHYSRSGSGEDVVSAEPDSLKAETQERFAQTWHERLGLPYVMIARPGIYGSSGDHKERRRQREVLLVNGALDQLKTQYHVDRFVIVGQSSGGHLVGAMLAERDDISCAVAASGVLAVHQRAVFHGWPADITGFSDFWDPYDHVDEIRAAPGLRVFIIGDPRDTNVPFATQKAYSDRLAERGIDAHLLSGEATGSEYHGLGRTGRLAAGWCAEGIATEEIIKRLGQEKG